MSLNLEWGAVTGVTQAHTVAIGFKDGTRGFDMQQKNNQARELYFLPGGANIVHAGGDPATVEETGKLMTQKI